MKRCRQTPEQIIRKLRETERLIREGKTTPEAGNERDLGGVSPLAQPVPRMKADDANRLKELERENTQLNAIVADRAGEQGAVGNREGTDERQVRAGPRALVGCDAPRPLRR
jgi:hypothetical protein